MTTSSFGGKAFPALRFGEKPGPSFEQQGYGVVMRILVIEDDREAAAYLAKALKEAGHLCEHAFSGEDGWHLAEAGGYDVLVVDRMLPGRDGLSIVKDLRDRGDDAADAPQN